MVVAAFDAVVQVPVTAARYPLYSHGVERARFEYAVFLLNKNIEQVCGIMNHHHINIYDNCTKTQHEHYSDALSAISIYMSGEDFLLNKNIEQVCINN